MKTSLFSFRLVAAISMAAAPLICHGQVNSGSDGSDGPFNPTANIVINMTNRPNGIYQYTSVYISNGVTVTFIPNANNTPVVWLVQSDCTIAGSVSVSGRGATNSLLGQIGGPGGWRGGNGAITQGSLPESGLGPGGGKIGGSAGLFGGKIG